MIHCDAAIRRLRRRLPMVSGMGRRALLPWELKAERIGLVRNSRLFHTQLVPEAALCPRCGEVSWHVRGQYRRCFANLPEHGPQVRLVLHARRFRCRSPQCRTWIIVQRFYPAIAQPCARSTGRLQKLFRHLGLVCASSHHLAPGVVSDQATVAAALTGSWSTVSRKGKYTAWSLSNATDAPAPVSISK